MQKLKTKWKTKWKPNYWINGKTTEWNEAKLNKRNTLLNKYVVFDQKPNNWSIIEIIDWACWNSLM